MNSHRLLIAGALAALGLVLAPALTFAETDGPTEPELKPQTTCPVMGGKINKNLFVDHNGWRLYVCCPGCVGAVKKDPAHYVTQLQDAGVQLDQTPQKTCPVMGRPINKDISATIDGRTIYFCCNHCVSEFEKDPATYLKKIGITLEEKTEETEAAPADNGQH